MAKRDLTAQRLREVLHYEPDTGLFTRRIRRGSFAAGTKAGSLGCFGYLLIMVDGVSYLSHRLAWIYVHGEHPPNDIDHINGIRTDNRIDNLRLATRAENRQNERKPRSTNRSGFLGICWSAKEHKWIAQITVNYTNRRVGAFDSAEEAHAAYVKAKRELHRYCSV